MRVFSVGGTGFVGVNLANRLLARGDAATVMGQSAQRPGGLAAAVPVVAGDARAPVPWQERIVGHDVVINLAGASIFTRWTAAAKTLIRRVAS